MVLTYLQRAVWISIWNPSYNNLNSAQTSWPSLAEKSTWCTCLNHTHIYKPAVALCSFQWHVVCQALASLGQTKQFEPLINTWPVPRKKQLSFDNFYLPTADWIYSWTVSYVSTPGHFCCFSCHLVMGQRKASIGAATTPKASRSSSLVCRILLVLSMHAT